MLHSVLFMTLSPLLGYAVDVYSLAATLIWMGVTLILTAGGFALAYGGKKVIRKNLGTQGCTKEETLYQDDLI
jgi:hypothetical protein